LCGKLLTTVLGAMRNRFSKQDRLEEIGKRGKGGRRGEGEKIFPQCGGNKEHQERNLVGGKSKEFHFHKTFLESGDKTMLRQPPKGCGELQDAKKSPPARARNRQRGGTEVKSKLCPEIGKGAKGNCTTSQVGMNREELGTNPAEGKRWGLGAKGRPKVFSNDTARRNWGGETELRGPISCLRK